MTPERIAEIRARLGLITPGQWHCAIEGTETDGIAVLIQEGRGEIPFGCCADGSPDEADCDFCAHAPDDIRDLITHIDTLTAELADARRETVEECIAICRDFTSEIERGASGGNDQAKRGAFIVGTAMWEIKCRLRALLDKPAPEAAVCVWRWRIGWLHADCDPCTPTTHPETSDKCPKCGRPIQVEG